MERVSNAAGSNDIFMVWPFNEIHGLRRVALKNTPTDRRNQVNSLQTRVSALLMGFNTRPK
ncbi:hypothetical protein DOX53_21695 [Cronobacter malonaticus]|uniref:Uncharacterized protein n=1 Tax=Enterobacter hormaechei TaxID=158836 RepID=A0A855VKS7_9ENTR|nr:hypothetical protein [Escherichia coli]EGT4282117.1 hypothetical protein [Cronobacter malonaticus]NCH12448.1 hypothetical protein [Cronobacter sakazakii]PTX80968.1 hypothetical protein C1O12_24650 [Enterobacter hormaechei]HAS1418343.1 hypothetical protein [Enterobacter asburiae]